jgi:putative acetyltransferase
LVARLRSSVKPQLSLVAELDGRSVGHIFFSPVTLDRAPSCFSAAGLAPLGVTPAFQRQGIGSSLVRVGLQHGPTLGWDAIFVVGDPTYYSRFGFVPAVPLGLRYESPAVLELSPGVLAGCWGAVHYHQAFSQV